MLRFISDVLNFLLLFITYRSSTPHQVRPTSLSYPRHPTNENPCANVSFVDRMYTIFPILFTDAQSWRLGPQPLRLLRTAPDLPCTFAPSLGVRRTGRRLPCLRNRAVRLIVPSILKPIYANPSTTTSYFRSVHTSTHWHTQPAKDITIHTCILFVPPAIHLPVLSTYFVFPCPIARQRCRAPTPI